MASTNPFELLGESDTGDFECLLARAAAKQQEGAAAKQQEAAALAGKKHEVSQTPQTNEAPGRARGRGWGQGRGRGSGGWGRGKGWLYVHRGPQEYGNAAYYGQAISGWGQEGIGRYDSRGIRRYDNRGGYYRGGDYDRWVEDKEDQSSESRVKLQTEQETCEAVECRNEKNEGNSEEEKVNSENKKKSKSKEFPESASEKQKPRQEDYAKRMTLSEYEKVLQESRKTLETIKPKERTVDPDQYIGLKIVGKKQLEDVFESVQIIKGSEENKEKAKEEKRVFAPKVISINEFLKGYRGSRGRSQTQFGRSGMNGSRYWDQHNLDPVNSSQIDSTCHVVPNGAIFEGNYSNWHRSNDRYQGHNSGHNEDKSNNGGTGYNGMMSSHSGGRHGYNGGRQCHANATYNENMLNTSYNRSMHNNGSRFNGARHINNNASYTRVGPVNNDTSYNGDRQGHNDAYYSGDKHNDYLVADETKVPATPIVQVGLPPSIEDIKEFPTLPGVPK